MPKIEIKNTCIIIHNYTPGDSPSIERFFSVWDKLTHRAYPKAIKYNEETKELFLPRGIDIGWVEAAMQSDAEINTDCDLVSEIRPIMLKFLPRDDTQKEAIKFLLGEGRYSYTTGKSQLMCNLNPGEGKTYLSIVMAAVIGMRTIMITSARGWIEQWKDRILQYTDTAPNEIGFIIGSVSISRILNGNTNTNNIKFFLCSHGTLKSYGDKYGWDKIGLLFQKLGIGLKIYDEAHIDFDNICAIDFATNTYKTLYLTATPARSDVEENKIYQTAFKNVPSIDLFDDDKDPRTEYVALFFNSHPTAFDINRCKNAYGFDILKYIDYVVKRPNFYKLLYVLVAIAKKRGKTLIYIGKNDCIDTVYQWMNYWFPELRGNIGIYNSTIQDKDIKADQLNKYIILSTIKSCGAAIDIADLKLTIVLANPFKSKVIARQSLGRTRDKDTMYIEVVDKGFAVLKGYYKSKQGVFAKYATKCTDINLMDADLEFQYEKLYAKSQEYYNQFSKNQNLIHIVDRVKRRDI